MKPKNTTLPTVRVSEKLRRETEDCAKAMGMNLGEYIRYSLMEQNIKVKEEIEMEETIVRYSKCRLGEAEISIKGEFTGDDEELFYQHPMTGSWNTRAGSILDGWSEQDPDDQEEWKRLVEEIEQDNMLAQKIWDEVEIEY